MRRRFSQSRVPSPESRFINGFSLIEILVVVVILAVLCAAVSLAIAGAGGERQLSREAERAQALITYACERAELGGRDIGLSFALSGYRFSRLDHDVWLPYRGDELRARSWPNNVSAVLTQDGQRIPLTDDFPDKPQLLCYSSGELTAFRIELGLPDLTRTYRLDGQPDGQVALAAVESRAH